MPPLSGAERQRLYRQRRATETDLTTSLVRACVGEMRAAIPFSGERGLAARIVKTTWPGDQVALDLVDRAATAPAMTSTTGWAKELATPLFLDLLAPLGPLSAGAELLRQSLLLSFDRYNTITVPALPLPSPSNVSWVAEGAPIQVRRFTYAAGLSMSPHKLAAACGFSREQLESSNVEQIVRANLIASAALALDASLFDANAGSSLRPPGLLNGVGSLPPATSMSGDISQLVSAISPTVGLNIAFVGDPVTVVKIQLQPASQFDQPVLATSALPARTLIAVGLPALCATFAPTPRIEASRGSEMHFDDAAPTDIGTAGSPAVVAAPVFSSFQVDGVNMKLVQPVSWGLRAPNAISWVTNITW